MDKTPQYPQWQSPAHQLASAPELLITRQFWEDNCCPGCPTHLELQTKTVRAPPAVPEPSLNPMGWPPSHLRGGPRTEIRPCPPGCDPITPVKGKLVVWKETVQNECGRGSDRLCWGHNAVLAWKLRSLAPVTSTLGHRMLPSPVQLRLRGGCGHKHAEHQTKPDHGPSKFLIRKKKASVAVTTCNPGCDHL